MYGVWIMLKPFCPNVKLNKGAYVCNCESCGVPLDPHWPRKHYLVWETRWVPWGMVDAFEECEFGELGSFKGGCGSMWISAVFAGLALAHILGAHRMIMVFVNRQPAIDRMQ